MNTILYSFNKHGLEATIWEREITSASSEKVRFIPFNHEPYLDPWSYPRAQLLDDLYFARKPSLMRLYADVDTLIARENVTAMIVDNCPPYHPDWLRRLNVHKVLRTSDGAISAYDRDFPYIHAYDQVLYHTPAYSRDMSMSEKLSYVGAKRADFWPMGLFESAYYPELTESELIYGPRDIEVIFVGAQHVGKMPFLAKIKKALGSRCIMHGLSSIKKNLYFNCRFGMPGWITPIRFDRHKEFYRRAKIGFNLHNRGDDSIGNYRLFELPANGVLQISDGGSHLGRFFKVGEEIVAYKDVDGLIDLIRYYLSEDAQRQEIAAAGYRRVIRDYQMSDLLQQAADLVADAMSSAKKGGGV